MERKILVGITKDNELYFLTVSDEKYFSMSGESVTPITRGYAEEQVREQLEDGEGWRSAVEAEQTTLGLEDWVQWVLDTDGELAGFDNSLFDSEVTVDGVDYLFESGSCGQHEETEFSHLFIEKQELKDLMEAWKKYHLKDGVTVYQALVNREQYSIGSVLEHMEVQNFDGLAMQAITLINKE